jgi:hypothetical protein
LRSSAPERLSDLLRIALFVVVCHFAVPPVLAFTSSAGIRVQGPGVPPHLGFACCEHGIEQMQSLFDDQYVINDLRELHAEVAIPTLDFSAERAAVVRRLNQTGIPVIAWMMLSKEEGFYLNADNAPEAAARVAAFEKWSSDNGLKWAGVGLDIEPNFAELAALKTHRWRLITILLRRSLNSDRIAGARQEYSELIGQLQKRGYPVQTYQMPYIPAERSVHSTLLDRLLGTVDVRGNQEYLMLYTSFARQVGAGMIWSIGRSAQAIAIGSTDGDSAAGSGAGPLNWDEFSRDLIVASHFSHQIGVYDLEGCVGQGFLSRLKTFDWSQSVTIPADALQKADHLHRALQLVLWIGDHLLYLAAILLLAVAWMACSSRTRIVSG